MIPYFETELFDFRPFPLALPAVGLAGIPCQQGVLSWIDTVWQAYSRCQRSERFRVYIVTGADANIHSYNHLINQVCDGSSGRLKGRTLHQHVALNVHANMTSAPSTQRPAGPPRARCLLNYQNETRKKRVPCLPCTHDA